MTHQKERRKLWAFSLSPGNWIAIIIFAFGTTLAMINGYIRYAQAIEKVDSNATQIAQVKEEFSVQMENMKNELSIRINQSEKRTRADVREVRQILLNRK